MNTLKIMCGPSGSGKSYYAKTNLMNNSNIYVSRDEIRFALLEEGDAYFSKEKQVYDIFIKRIINGIIQGKDVIVDATNLNFSSRNKLYNALDKYIKDKYNIEFYCIETSLLTCKKQNAFRFGRSNVPEEAINNMYFSYKRPSKLEHSNIIKVEVIYRE